MTSKKSCIFPHAFVLKAFSALLFGTFLSACLASASEFTVEKTDEGVTVNLDGKLFTKYLTKSGKKPILWPVIGPTGKSITRDYPMVSEEKKKGDHDHHRSLWFSHGTVSGTDLWAEGPGTGSTVHREFVGTSGGAQAKIVTQNDWLDPHGKKLCEDQRTITCSTSGSDRLIDFDVTVKADKEPVTFGDTEEGSFGMRVNDNLRVTARKGGRIVNSLGATDKNAWGKAAPWCDYSGPLDGETVGIAIMNHPQSYGFPTHWHVRDYGLFAANPFGLHDFEDAAAGAGNLTLKPGEVFTLRYRVVLHKGSAGQAKIAERFTEYARTP